MDVEVCTDIFSMWLQKYASHCIGVRKHVLGCNNTGAGCQHCPQCGCDVNLTVHGLPVDAPTACDLSHFEIHRNNCTEIVCSPKEPICVTGPAVPVVCEECSIHHAM